ncbi:hypothetical protein ACLOAV_008349 [Pseudogymnoascus australis]
MSLHDNPLHISPGRALNLQKYLLLHSQHDVLHTHLAASAASPSNFPASQSSSITTSIPSSSPADLRERQSSLLPSFPSTPNDGNQRHNQSLLSTAEMCCGLGDLLEEERILMNVNQQIKTTLTELLNCEGVKQDRRYCAWFVLLRIDELQGKLRG